MEKKWEDEPSDYIFNHLGFKCVCKRQRTMKTWLGYIVVPQNHPWFSVDQAIFNELGILKNRKITYTGHNPFTPDPKQGEWWIGFDCTQEFDLIPMHWEVEGPSHPRLFKHHVYKDLDFVKDQLKFLAEAALRMNQAEPV